MGFDSSYISSLKTRVLHSHVDVFDKLQNLRKQLTLKAPNKNCSGRHFIFILLSFKENKT